MHVGKGCKDSGNLSYSATTPGHADKVYVTIICVSGMPDDSGILVADTLLFKLEPSAWYVWHNLAPIMLLSPCFSFLTVSLLLVSMGAVLVNASHASEGAWSPTAIGHSCVLL